MSIQSTLARRGLGPSGLAFSATAPAVLGLALAACVSSSALSQEARIASASAGYPIQLNTHGDNDKDVAPLLARPLDAESAVRIALLRNQRLAARLTELGIHRGKLIDAGRPANPVLEVESVPERDSSYELRLEYQISSLILAPARKRIAGFELESEHHALASSVVEHAKDVRVAVYQLQAAQAHLEIAREAAGAQQTSRVAVEEQAAAGNIPQGDQATAVAAHESARALVARAEIDASEAKLALQMLLGLDASETFTVTAPLPELPEHPPPLAAEPLAVQDNHELAALRAQGHAHSARAREARIRGWMPDVSMDVHALRAADDVSDPWRMGAGVSLTLPVFDRRQGEVMAHSAATLGKEQRITDLTRRLSATFLVAKQRRRIAYERARRYRDTIVPGREAAMKNSILQYNAMQISIFELLSARRELSAAQTHLANAARDYWIADAAVRSLVEGGPIGRPTNDAPRLDPQGE